MALQKAGPAIRAQALIYPVLDLADTSEGSFERYARGYFLESEALRRAYGLYLHGAPAEHPWASPLRAPSLRGCPRPSLRRRNATSWWTTGWSTPSGCRRPGTAVEYHLYEGMPHGFLVHPYRQTFAALDAVGRFCAGI